MDWQNKPPTDKQLDAIYNMRKALNITGDKPITRGQAANIIKTLLFKIELINAERTVDWAELNPEFDDYYGYYYLFHGD